MWAHIENDTVVRVYTTVMPVEIGGVAYPAQIFNLWSAAELAAIGIIPATYADTAPSAHHVATGESWEIVEGEAVGTRTWELLAPTQAQLLAYADQRRSMFREAGTSVTLGGHPIPVRTDRTTRNDVVAAQQQAEAVPGWTTRWKLANGVWVTIDEAAIVAIANAIAAHWQDAMTREDGVTADIIGGTVTTYAAIDAAFT